MNWLNRIPMNALVFYFFSLISVCSAIVVVSSRNIVHAVISLMFTFFGVAGLYVLLHADFIAAVQVLIYVGGILTLLLFGVMLTNKITDLNLRNEHFQIIPSLVVAAGIFLILLRLIRQTPWKIVPEINQGETIRTIGKLLMNEYLLPFEVASILLLAALIGAVVLGRREQKPAEEMNP